jgi:hypothetical protein
VDALGQGAIIMHTCPHQTRHRRSRRDTVTSSAMNADVRLFADDVEELLGPGLLLLRGWPLLGQQRGAQHRGA